VPIARIAGFTGRMMIRAGLLILLFVAYQLWGTGLHTARAQDALRNEFRDKQAAVGELPGEQVPENGPAGSTPTQPTTTLGPTTAPTEFEVPAPGEPIGFISIPDINSDFYIVAGVDLRWLQEGPGHFPSTPLPGQPGNAALAGHRTTFKAPFNRLDELQAGSLIFIETLQGKFTYEVMDQPTEPGAPPTAHYIVGPRQTEILDDKGDNRLTLMACHPKYSAAQRIVVEAKLVSNPAPPTPRPPAEETVLPGDLAGGDDSARVPAILLSVAAAFVWMGAWYVGRRWRGWKWPAYALAFPAFAVLLFLAFDHINRLLPAAY
jgi:sortase A